MSIINIENLIVDYKITGNDGASIDKRALNGISLKIEEGEFVCIIGRNGSGKSTLAKSLNALIIPSSGDVIIDSINTKDEEKVIELRKKVGMAFQNPDNQIVASIVEEDVAFGLENIGIPTEEIRKRIDKAMKILSIYDLKDSMVSKLSGGQKQRVSIAGILAMESKIIVLDEPTSMLDAIGREDLIKVITKLSREQHITIVLISHNIDEIYNADKVVVMNKGEIRYVGTPSEVFDKPDLLDECGVEFPYIEKAKIELKKRGIIL